MFGGGDARDNKAVVAGQFKGLVQVFNIDRKEKRTEVILEKLETMKSLVKQVYEAQLKKNFGFDFDRLDHKNSGKEAYGDLKALLVECGLGTMKIHEFIANIKF